MWKEALFVELIFLVLLTNAFLVFGLVVVDNGQNYVIMETKVVSNPLLSNGTISTLVNEIAQKPEFRKYIDSQNRVSSPSRILRSNSLSQWNSGGTTGNGGSYYVGSDAINQGAVESDVFYGTPLLPPNDISTGTSDSFVYGSDITSTSGYNTINTGVSDIGGSGAAEYANSGIDGVGDGVITSSTTSDGGTMTAGSPGSIDVATQISQTWETAQDGSMERCERYLCDNRVNPESIDRYYSDVMGIVAKSVDSCRAYGYFNGVSGFNGYSTSSFPVSNTPRPLEVIGGDFSNSLRTSEFVLLTMTLSSQILQDISSKCIYDYDKVSAFTNLVMKEMNNMVYCSRNNIKVKDPLAPATKIINQFYPAPGGGSVPYQSLVSIPSLGGGNVSGYFNKSRILGGNGSLSFQNIPGSSYFNHSIKIDGATADPKSILNSTESGSRSRWNLPVFDSATRQWRIPDFSFGMGNNLTGFGIPDFSFNASSMLPSGFTMGGLNGSFSLGHFMNPQFNSSGLAGNLSMTLPTNQSATFDYDVFGICPNNSRFKVAQACKCGNYRHKIPTKNVPTDPKQVQQRIQDYLLGRSAHL
jgi:hypothetical protein